MELFYIIFWLYICIFALSIYLSDNSIVDIFWWTWFIIMSLILIIQNESYSLAHIIVWGLIWIWGTRLTYFIARRKIKHKWEDFRYANWRKQWKFFFLRSFFQVYILQMLLMFVIALPFFFIFSNNLEFNFIYFLGISISIIWLAIEILADYQVSQFIKTNTKPWMVFTWGLYKYSRNPNYFWESTFWLGLSIVWSMIHPISILSYITITFLLLFVSWVPMKEKRQSMKANRKEYKRKTSLFIPWFPKN